MIKCHCKYIFIKIFDAPDHSYICISFTTSLTPFPCIEKHILRRVNVTEYNYSVTLIGEPAGIDEVLCPMEYELYCMWIQRISYK